MKTRSSHRPVAGEERHNAVQAQSAAQLAQAPAASMADERSASLAQLQHQERASNSTQAAQLKAYADMMAGHDASASLQRVEDEDLLQGKFDTAQREMDEELLQGKFATAQREVDEELLQGKFDPVQRMDEEELLQGKFATLAVAQREEKPNNTGMPGELKSGIESLSGMSMDHVKVHYNSAKPAQLNAHAYAQGSDIHMAPGQEQHLPHEAWHVVQQMQGRVQPTTTVGDAQVNDNPGLESEATAMGEKALQRQQQVDVNRTEPILNLVANSNDIHQRQGQAQQLTSVHEVGTSAFSSPDSAHVLQSIFTATGEKQKKIRQWVGTTKKALQENGEDLLLELFIKMAKEDTETEWDIRETFTVTRWNLRQLLDDVDDGPITTVLDDDEPTKALSGAKSGTGYKRLAAWDLVDRGALDPTTHTEISHVSTNDDWMTNRIDPMYGAATGELGPGFYTVSGHGDAAVRAVRDEFGKTGNVPREVLTFRIDNEELGALVNWEGDLAAFLVYVLQHSSGYPPGSNHMAMIKRINVIGKALIFPDKTTLVDIDSAETKFSYDTYRAANGAAGGHSLIVGPQARPSLDGIRQIAARGYLGDKILNEAARRKSTLGGLNT